MSTPDSSFLDEIILGMCSPRLQKVAMIVAKSLDECEARSLLVTSQEIWGRIAFLVDSGRLEAFGDISNWRSSEVRLP
jgi:hypothetical protein